MPGGSKTIISDTDYPSPYELTISLSGVLGIKAYAHAFVSSGGGPSNDNSNAQIYEVQAWGPLYTDSGLRIGSGIGKETLNATHKLRVRDGATTYGIPLLATSDVDASPVRVYDGAAVKSLPKVVLSADFVRRSDTVHTYVGGTNAGALSMDSNFTTYYERAGASGGCAITSQHIFAVARDITKLAFRLGCYGYAYGDSWNTVNLDIHIYTTTDGTNWTERYVRSA